MANRLQKSDHAAITNQVQETVDWDREVSQLGLRSRAGRQTWIVQWREHGRTKKKTLGLAQELTVELDRELAKSILVPPQPPATRTNWTVSEFANVNLEDQAASWKAATQYTNHACVQKKIKPYLGDKLLMSISAKDVQDWLDQLDESTGSKNRALAVLSEIMKHAEIKEAKPAATNPCKGQRRRDAEFKAHYFERSQFETFGKTLAKLEPKFPIRIAFFRFVFFTGCRRGEAQTLRWDMIEGKSVHLPDSKTGPRLIWLNKQAINVLNSLNKQSDFVFPDNGKPISDYKVNSVWDMVREDMKLPKLRIHDLRHNFASVAVNGKIELKTIGQLLGHTRLDTTEGYAKLGDKVTQEASSTIYDAIGRSPKVMGRNAMAVYCKRFVQTKGRLNLFCRKNGLQAEEFRMALKKWRQTQQNGVAL